MLAQRPSMAEQTNLKSNVLRFWSLPSPISIRREWLSFSPNRRQSDRSRGRLPFPHGRAAALPPVVAVAAQGSDLDVACHRRTQAATSYVGNAHRCGVFSQARSELLQAHTDSSGLGSPHLGAHIRCMKRVRALASVLACLAVLASGFMTVAAATLPSAAPAAERGLANAPCSHCDDCDGAPCPMPLASCFQVSSHAAPTLVSASVVLPPIESGKVRWSIRTATLSGQSPPPEPFPPRA
jgi:hypothetical protein